MKLAEQPWAVWAQILVGAYFCWDAPEWVIGIGFLIGANMSLSYWLAKHR